MNPGSPLARDAAAASGSPVNAPSTPTPQGRTSLRGLLADTAASRAPVNSSGPSTMASSSQQPSVRALLDATARRWREEDATNASQSSAIHSSPPRTPLPRALLRVPMTHLTLLAVLAVLASLPVEMLLRMRTRIPSPKVPRRSWAGARRRPCSLALFPASITGMVLVTLLAVEEVVVAVDGATWFEGLR
jgi:hypothetical protein